MPPRKRGWDDRLQRHRNHPAQGDDHHPTSRHRRSQGGSAVCVVQSGGAVPVHYDVTIEGDPGDVRLGVELVACPGRARGSGGR
jgi:hypothetical protein